MLLLYKGTKNLPYLQGDRGDYFDLEWAVAQAAGRGDGGKGCRDGCHNHFQNQFEDFAFVFHNGFCFSCLEFKFFNFNSLTARRASVGDVLEQFEGSFYLNRRESDACFLSCHSLYEARPFVLRQALFPTEASPAADVADVGLRVVLRGRGPASDDVGYAVQVVLVAVGPEQAERRPKSPFHRGKLAEGGSSPSPSRRRGSRGYFAFPRHFPAPDVQRIVIADT